MFHIKKVGNVKNIKSRWITKGIKVSRQRLQFLCYLKKKLILPRHSLNYIKKYQKIYKNVLADARKKENDRFIQKSTNRSKALWQIINFESGKAFKINYKTSDVDSMTDLDPLLTPGHFNSFFVEIAGKMVNQLNDQKPKYDQACKVTPFSKSIFFVPITENEVLSVTSKLKGKLSAGYDEIPEKLVKFSIQPICKPLTFIFNLSLCTGIFPDQMKIAKVRPIHKRGRIQELSNYRPISLLPVFSKIFETLIYNRVVNFLNKHNLISDAQNGFRQNKSTHTALQSFIEDVQKALDNKFFALGIFLDLSKAFDVINHKLLLAKLELYGFRGISLSLMRSYLTGRSQFVEIDHVDAKSPNQKSFSSSCKEIKYGVPQGSVLGPLLFLMFINDLPKAVHEAKVVLFADDTNILIIDKNLKSLNDKTIVSMHQLENWFAVNHLIINIEKTKALFFQGRGPRQIDKPELYLNNKKITYTANLKFLGIYITENLSWSSHIHHLVQKLNKTIYLIKSLRDLVSLPILRSVYFAKFESLLRYGIIFWGCGQKDIQTVFKIQKKCLRLIKRVNNRVSCREFFGEFKILTLTSLYIFETLCFLRKNRIYNISYSDVHGYNTVHKQNLYVQPCNTSRCKRSVINMGIRLYNNLPSQIRSIQEFKVFKRQLKDYLLCKAFYSLQEYFYKN
ncbi:hypothetical protein B7P43_G15963 [Cryptotermes secundus]|uniref:Reverse transcriptase domain-containing protein n=1 Tax=Cryptotermes secundus TaxID=105785 RepID=A0A2J7RGM0_9NEOP|nr:hypothetical protein B7P43_G15963 [Cryptotermes secundus]